MLDTLIYIMSNTAHSKGRATCSFPKALRQAHLDYQNSVYKSNVTYQMSLHKTGFCFYISPRASRILLSLLTESTAFPIY